MKPMKYLDRRLLLNLIDEKLETYKTPLRWKVPEEEALKDIRAYIVNEVPYIITEEEAN
jgi:hypothetical protein